MVPVILLARMGPIQPGTLIVVGSIFTVTLVTDALGVSTTGMIARLPAILITDPETQQFLPELNGSTMLHQDPSEFLPTIWEDCPTLSPLSTIHACPGPRRQFTFTSFADATGTVGVKVKVGSGVSVGMGVCVGTSVGVGCVADGTTVTVGSVVGVSVTGTLDGRLHACSTSIRANVSIMTFDFIVSPLVFLASYLSIIPLAIDLLESSTSSQDLLLPLTPSITRYMIANMTGEALKGHLDLLLLSVLSNRPAHGYAIIESLRARSDGVFDLPEGTIYPALHRLDDQGLLKSSWSDDTGRRKRVYQLTPKGQKALTSRQDEWLQFSKAINATVGI